MGYKKKRGGEVLYSVSSSIDGIDDSEVGCALNLVIL